jgi:type IV pilus assembly protein PilC
MVFVIPVFEEMFEGMGGALPVPTQIVVNMSRFIKGNILYMIAALTFIIFAFKRFYKTDKGQVLIDSLSLKLPVMGMLLRKGAVAKFTSTMSTMLSSGVSILDALNIVAKTAGNRTIEAAIYDVRSGITEGRTMADPLSESGVFPSMVCQMIVENMTALIEPFMLVFLGIVIGGLVVAMYLPIFKMAAAMG